MQRFSLLELVLKGIKEDSPYADVPVNVENLLSVLENFDSPSSKMFLLYDEDTPVGLLAGVITEQHPLWHGIKIASELFWYVHPDHRGKNSLKLVKDYETWAKENGCKYVTMAHFYNELGTKLSDLYSRLGYKEVEVSYLKELN